MNSYEEFLQAITELYDQNKLDFNNYKLLKNEIKKLESKHNQDIKNFRKYLNVLESKIKNFSNGGNGNSGLTTTQEQQITTAYNHSQSVHAPSNAEQNVQSNWNETNTSSDAYIKNKPTLSTVATSGSYNDLSNKPTIPSVPSNLVTGSSTSYIIWIGTQTQFDAISTKDNNTLYFIKEE